MNPTQCNQSFKQVTTLRWQESGPIIIRTLMTAAVFVLLYGCAKQNTVDLQRVPDNGIHPRIVVDSQDNTHLLYFVPEVADTYSTLGHLFYRPYDKSSDTWGDAIKVSSEPFNHRDPIFRAELAVSGDGRAHVVWYRARPSTYLYTRSNPQRTAFETETSIVEQYLEGVDAGAEIAVSGNDVVVVWAAGDLMKEEERTVYMRRSVDAGATFGDELQIGDKALGACACCGLAAEFDSTGNLLVAYRSATNGTGRDMQILNVGSNVRGDVLSSYLPLHDSRRWDLAACPVTTNAFVKDDTGNEWLVFENKSRVSVMPVVQEAASTFVADQLPETREKHPAMAFDSAGKRLVAWGEGAGFSSGGKLHWALFDNEGMQIAHSAADTPDIPDNSFSAVMTPADGRFVILY